MVSCVEIETVSLAFATLNLLITTLGSVVSISLLVYVNIIISNNIVGAERKFSTDIEETITNYGLYFNIGLAVTLSIFAVAFVFSIVLTKGLVSKKAHLVKAYFIYGVTMNVFSIISILGLYAYQLQGNPLGVLVLIGCFVHACILKIIQKTYLNLSNIDADQFCHKKLEAEKSIA